MLPELKDDVFLTHFTDGEVVYRRADPLEPGASRRRAASVSGAGSARLPASASRAVGRRLHGELHGERDGAEVEESQLAARGAEERPLTGQLDAGRLELDPNRRRPIAERLRRPPPPGQLAGLALQDKPGAIEVDLVADVEGKRQVNRHHDRVRGPEGSSSSLQLECRIHCVVSSRWLAGLSESSRQTD